MLRQNLNDLLAFRAVAREKSFTRLRKNSTPNRWRDRVTYDSIMWRGFLPEGHRCAGRINERTACFLM
jgi:hypothetical protein